MQTLQKQISLFTEEILTSLRADSLANHTALPGLEREKMTNAICGRTCLERFERLNHVGLWAKTFSALLVGTGGWYSKRCKLTWKLKGTKYNRIYFQLQPSTLPIEETGFGLLPTVTAVQRDHPEHVDKLKAVSAETLASRKAGNLRPSYSIMDAVNFYGILPTPQARDWKAADKPESGNFQRKLEKGWTIDLNSLAQMLPTPMASDCGDKVTGLENQDSLTKRARSMTGKTSQLNPLFVMEMMGFPPDWTLLPFLNGETNQ